MDRTAQALEVMTREDPELATRLFLQMLPAAAQRLEGPLKYDLEIDRLGTWRVEVDGNGGGARGERLRDGADGEGDFTNSSRGGGGRGGARGGVALPPPGGAAGAAPPPPRQSPLKLMMRGEIRIRGKRR